MSSLSHARSARRSAHGAPARAARSVRTGLARRALARIVGVGILVGALTACATIPSSGPVERRDVTISELGPIFPQSYGPSPGDSPEEIVRGFLIAQPSGLADDWTTAREFLTARGARAWDPSARTVVYSAEPDYSPTVVAESDGGPGGDLDTQAPPADGGLPDGTPDDLGDLGDLAPSDAPPSPAPGSPTADPETATTASIRGRVAVAALLDTDGRFTEPAQGTVQDITFTLEKSAAGEWRIAATEDGIFVSEPNFQLVYRATTLYFLSLDKKYLVPEVRWYSKVNTATHAVNAVLAGPSPWLRDSVMVVAPVGTRLLLDSVTVNDSGVAKVDLTKEVLSASDEDRAMLQAQLSAVLMKVPRVRSVQLLANSLPLSIPMSANPLRDPAPSLPGPLVLADEQISQIQDKVAVPLAGFRALTGLDPTALATDDAAQLVVLRSGTTMIRTAPTPSSEAATLVTGTDLVAPSIDRFGWVWTGDRVAGDGLRAVTATGTQVTVAADWLDGRSLESIRVSHDGARIAIVSSLGEESRIDVAAIVRDDSGVPVRLSDEALAIGASVPAATQVVWVDESTVGVLARGVSSGIATFYEVPLSGRSAALSGVDDTVWIAAGKGLRSVYVATSEGELLSRATTGNTWSVMATGVHIPAFPG